MSDGSVTVPPDSTGKKIDTSELARADGTVVERQRIALGSPTEAGFLAVVDSQGRTVAVVDQADVVVELRRIAFLLEVLTGTKVSAADVA